MKEQGATAPTPQPPKTEPYLSDYAITKAAESYADLEMTKNDGESYSTHLGGYEFGARNTRITYERELSKLRAENEALRSAGQIAADALGQLRRRHLVVEEDQWYTCPAAKDENGERLCSNDGASVRCDCGADKSNSIIDIAITSLNNTLQA